MGAFGDSAGGGGGGLGGGGFGVFPPWPPGGGGGGAFVSWEWGGGGGASAPVRAAISRSTPKRMPASIASVAGSAVHPRAPALRNARRRALRAYKIRTASICRPSSLLFWMPAEDPAPNLRSPPGQALGPWRRGLWGAARAGPTDRRRFATGHVHILSAFRDVGWVRCEGRQKPPTARPMATARGHTRRQRHRSIQAPLAVQAIQPSQRAWWL